MDPETLFQRARRGDRQAWNDLLAWIRPIVRALLRQRMRQPDEASDVTNEAQVRMHRGFGQFRGDPDSIASLTFDPPCPRQPAESPPLSDQLARALERLPEDQRRVVEARLVDGLRPGEIAVKFGWPAVRVSVYYLRAIRNLSRQLQGEL